jgi:hypothetical protein
VAEMLATLVNDPDPQVAKMAASGLRDAKGPAGDLALKEHDAQVAAGDQEPLLLPTTQPATPTAPVVARRTKPGEESETGFWLMMTAMVGAFFGLGWWIMRPAPRAMMRAQAGRFAEKVSRIGSRIVPFAVKQAASRAGAGAAKAAGHMSRIGKRIVKPISNAAGHVSKVRKKLAERIAAKAQEKPPEKAEEKAKTPEKAPEKAPEKKA